MQHRAADLSANIVVTMVVRVVRVVMAIIDSNTYGLLQASSGEATSNYTYSRIWGISPHKEACNYSEWLSHAAPAAIPPC